MTPVSSAGEKKRDRRATACLFLRYSIIRYHLRYGRKPYSASPSCSPLFFFIRANTIS